MKKDIRGTELYSEAENIARLTHQPASGLIVDALELDVDVDGSRAVFSGVIVDDLEGEPPTRICLADLTNGATRVLTSGPNKDRAARFSPDGTSVAFLSDRTKAGDFQLYFLDLASGAARAAPKVDGWIEYLRWSEDGKRILLGVAGHGADISGGAGAVTSKKAEEASVSWLPQVETAGESFRWRSAWIYNVTSNTVRQVPTPKLNIWEANWCGLDALVAVVSPAPHEGAWYTATLNIIDVQNGEAREIYKPADQIGWPSASPSGDRLALVEAVCSDRWIVAGGLLVLNERTGAIDRVQTNGADVTYTHWRSESRILLGAHRGFETVVLEYDSAGGALTEGWSDSELTGIGRHISLAPLGHGVGDCAFIGEGYLRPPELGVVKAGSYRTAVSFDRGAGEQVRDWVGKVETITWPAPDGLDIQGWLLRPKMEGPFPLVMHVHGGPVWHWRPHWFGRNSYSLTNLMLLKHGYAIFQPNPRGSSCRGQDYARHVLGDLNGADTHDNLSGLDYLTERGIADPRRIGVMGASYGGCMTSWLITQDQRFAAAVPMAPHTDQVSQHLVSNIPDFDALFLADKYNNPGGKYFQRSAIMHADKVRTPTLNIAGALDRCTPPTQAVQFHNALLEHGVTSTLVIYPEEGHGVRNYPAVLDYMARVVGWFEEHMSSGRST